MKIYKSKKELIQDQISENDVVLDVGFWGQAVGVEDKNWIHNILKSQAKEVFGVDVNFDKSKLENPKITKNNRLKILILRQSLM